VGEFRYLEYFRVETNPLFGREERETILAVWFKRD